ncbi:eukaryotic translation initiation factor 3 subunit J-like isoform X2 [Homarus americanus]|uniref:eukaryotic translation initiation factor 3 subunit J-like isoform X2 n=1 Tax=Homarus americanus TaxID=6706 RepID=UPI001C4395A3|nr:eukaryotic translation initiation factor 3 subunit J-like isoform X2 [Homarus americanus]
MSDVEWDADDFVPPTAAAARPTDKWDGEDEDDIKFRRKANYPKNPAMLVRVTLENTLPTSDPNQELNTGHLDNWDDEEEDKEKTATDSTAAPVKKKKKKLTDIIAEKEARQLEELEKRKKEAEEKAKLQTAEGKLAEKMRLQKIQEDSDLQLANELLGSTSSITEEDNKMLDDIDLSTSSGLESFRKALTSKIRISERLEKRPFFVTFVEDICRDLCQNLEVEEVKRVSTVINSIYNEKVKAGKPKSKKKAGGKAKLNVGQGAIADDLGNDFGGYNEYDDFI